MSLKLVTLLGLTAPDRSSDLAKRDLRFRTFHPQGVSFSPSGLSKTSRPGDLAKTSFHAAFKEDKDLCPVECLKCYELRTKEFRSFTNGVNKLFLSYILPHKPVSSATLARWIKSLLQLAGVDTTIFFGALSKRSGHYRSIKSRCFSHRYIRNGGLVSGEYLYAILL